MSKLRHDSYSTISPISGIGFVEALTILFIAYKLAGLIAWSWLWVLSPLWITLSLMTAVVLLSIILVIVMALLDCAEEHKRNVRRHG